MEGSGISSGLYTHLSFLLSLFKCFWMFFPLPVTLTLPCAGVLGIDHYFFEGVAGEELWGCIFWGVNFFRHSYRLWMIFLGESQLVEKFFFDIKKQDRDSRKYLLEFFSNGFLCTISFERFLLWECFWVIQAQHCSPPPPLPLNKTMVCPF